MIDSEPTDQYSQWFTDSTPVIMFSQSEDELSNVTKCKLTHGASPSIRIPSHHNSHRYQWIIDKSFSFNSLTPRGRAISVKYVLHDEHWLGWVQMLRHWRNLLSGWECFLCMGCLEKLDHLICQRLSKKPPLKSTHVLSLDRKKGMIIEAEKHTLYLYHHRATGHTFFKQKLW